MRKRDGTHSIIQRTVPLRASATSELQSKHARVILSQVIVVLQSMLLNAENVRSKSSHPFNPHLHRNAPPLAAQNRKHFDSAPKTLRSIGRGQASVRASSRGRVGKQDTAIAEDAYVRIVWTEGPLSRERQSGDLGNVTPTEATRSQNGSRSNFLDLWP